MLFTTVTQTFLFWNSAPCLSFSNSDSAMSSPRLILCSSFFTRPSMYSALLIRCSKWDSSDCNWYIHKLTIWIGTDLITNIAMHSIFSYYIVVKFLLLSIRISTILIGIMVHQWIFAYTCVRLRLCISQSCWNVHMLKSFISCFIFNYNLEEHLNP